MLIDIYLQSLYWENLRKYEAKYTEVQKQKNECTNEAQKEVLEKELKSVYKKKFSRGYFRDGYDNFNLLERLSLDYNTLVFPFLDAEYNLPVEKVKELRLEISNHEIDEKFKPMSHSMQGFMVGEIMTPEKIFNLKRKFILLLDEAIKRNEPVLFKVTGGNMLTEEEKAKILKDLGVM